MSESVILCEGYHDRAFWQGWLAHLGCKDARMSGAARRGRAYDPWNTEVTGGQYAYLSVSGKFIRVTPCHGKTKIRLAAETRLLERASKALAYLVINVDADTTVGGQPSGPLGLRGKDVAAFVAQMDPSTTVNADGEIEVDAGSTKVALVRWEVADPPTAGLPAEQTLERLVCAAIVAAYPARGNAVQDWLRSRQQPPGTNPKEHAWSFMAGWYADYGCEAFYAHAWQDPTIAGQLEVRLRASGAWQVAERLAT